ncbi:MAG TPA: hypothetical protein VFH80_07270 [Solirubrobacteraceae bacterium]|nr:hypothetical protein [Solirubrobacteraceae bacterium]
MSGLLIIVLGVWGGLIPFIGPYFHYSFGGDQTWHFTMQRLWLDILPGAVAVLGGFMLMTASSRIGGLTAGWVALVAGAWFVVGPAVALLWDQNIYAIGAPHGGSVRRMLEWVGYFGGLGAVIVGLAAFAMGRYFSRPRVAGEAAAVAADAVEAERVHHSRRTAAVADAPAERAAVADRPIERETVADRPVEREAVADRPVERDAVANEPAEGGPVSETRAADAPIDRGDRGAMTEAPAHDTPAEETRAADGPTQTVPAEAGDRATYTPTGTTVTGTRRSGGLLGRFRR